MQPLNQSYSVLWPLEQGVQQVIVSGLTIPFTPLTASATTGTGAGGGAILTAEPVTGTLTNAGGTFVLNAPPMDANQTLTITFLEYLAPAAPGSMAFWQSPTSPAWTWTPESGLPLASPALAVATFENTLMNNLGEFLSGYFNGGWHVLQNGAPQPFPSAVLRFQQSQSPQPLEGVLIRTVLSDPGKLVQVQFGGEYQGWQQVMLELHIQAALKDSTPIGGNANLLCRTTADLLYGLLSDRGASVPLQKNGFRYLRPSAPGIIENMLYSTRRIRLNTRCVFMTPATGLQPGGD